MFPTPQASGVAPQCQALQPFPPASSAFWRPDIVHEHSKSLKETVNLLQAMQKELEEILAIRRSNQKSGGGDDAEHMNLQLFEMVKEKKISLEIQEALSLEASKSVFTLLKNQLLPFGAVTSQLSPWEERSVVVRLADKLKKHERNKRWRKRKRRGVAEALRKECENYDKADKEADEWRAREIAKDIAKQKVENMKAIAKRKANEEKKRLESELELVLIVEKLQELRSIRIQKLKKLGHFLPEEDDKFLERVQAAVEEEERQAAAAVEIGAAKEAIATAEGSRKANENISTVVKNINHDKCDGTAAQESQEQSNGNEGERSLGADGTNLNCAHEEIKSQDNCEAYDMVKNLPVEFYQYYHGSSHDMGTLIEVRRMWDTYIRPGGSRIPGHWVQPPPPADEVWASYLVRHR